MDAATLIVKDCFAVVLAFASLHPYVFAGTVIAVVSCVFTRIKTGYQARLDASGAGDSAKGHPVPMLPYWIPFVGHTIPFATRFLDFLQEVADSKPTGIFALKIMGTTHHMVVSPGLTKELLGRPGIPVDISAFTFRFLRLVFADRDAFQNLSDNNPEGYEELHKIMVSMMRDPFIAETSGRLVNAVEERTADMLSLNDSWVDHAIWERSARVEVISRNTPYKGVVVEADLYALTRNFVGEIATSLLLGHAFVENNPGILQDLWVLDAQVNTLMLGLPNWLAPSLSRAAAARARLTNAIIEHHDAMSDQLDGKDPGYRYADLGDVSTLIWDRVRSFKRSGLTPHARGAGDAVILWAMNVNANKIIFWMLYFIYRDPALLADLRAELAPHVTLRRAAPTGLPIPPAPRLHLDLPALLQKCPLLKGAFFETMRLEAASVFYRTVTADFTLTETAADASRSGKRQSTPTTYTLKKGDMLCVPFPVEQNSPKWYPDPARFDPRRFWTRSADPDEKGPERIAVEYGNLRPWGGRQNMCKGRLFAEREVLAFVAGIVMMWEVETADSRGWEHPGNKVVAGTYDPKRDIRVRMWRREW